MSENIEPLGNSAGNSNLGTCFSRFSCKVTRRLLWLWCKGTWRHLRLPSELTFILMVLVFQECEMQEIWDLGELHQISRKLPRSAIWGRSIFCKDLWPLCETVMVKFNLQWRTQDIWDTRNAGHLPRRSTGTEWNWSKREDTHVINNRAEEVALPKSMKHKGWFCLLSEQMSLLVLCVNAFTDSLKWMLPLFHSVY